MKNTNREIKFRYIWKSPENTIKRFIYTLDELEVKDVSYVLADYEASGWKLLGRVQFTGLSDKNGVEIWEGDIVSIIRCSNKNHFACNCKKKPDIDFTDVVVFKDGMFTAPELERPINEYEVIGNIWENSNLNT